MSEEEAPPIYDSDPNEDTSWLVTYGDMVTLLMVFFVLMFSHAVLPDLPSGSNARSSLTSFSCLVSAQVTDISVKHDGS